MFEQTFYFVVMLNCFDPKADIQERFDIKGSWVGRSADAVKPTKKVVCRHCNSYFVPMAKEQCTVIVGRHEANVVLKDNDLRTKISFHPDDAVKVVEILKKDSDLLGKLGVLDYSLLLGIKKWKFPVTVSNEEVRTYVRAVQLSTLSIDHCFVELYGTDFLLFVCFGMTLTD
jgi:hypothetical protein